MVPRGVGSDVGCPSMSKARPSPSMYIFTGSPGAWSLLHAASEKGVRLHRLDSKFGRRRYPPAAGQE
ncbi:MAG: hypothetical protein ACLU99_13660 [Alphaproteobacteria bacterium]